ncbi:hypothetical protein J5X84_43605 [Streptosporangiaceae bacterium NEAU-GS5]|nr:hypothetical protein [Streptosporangiaceae bacterium NEAU-GS5]
MTTTKFAVELAVKEDLALSASAWLEQTYDAKAHLISVYYEGRRFLTPDELAFLASPPSVWTPYAPIASPEVAQVAA